MLYLVGIIIILFLAFLLITKQNKTGADKILFVWFIIVGLHLFLFYIYDNGYYKSFPYLLGVDIPLPLIHGPMLYMYTASITNQSKKWIINILHFIPVILLYIFLIDFYFSSEELKIYTYDNDGKGFEPLMQSISMLINLSGIIYFILSLSILRNHKKNISDYFSFSERINLNWLRNLIFGIGFIWLFVFFADDKLTYGVIVLFVIFIGYFGINQVGIFNQNNSYKELLDESSIINETKIDFIKYEKSNLNEEFALRIQEDMNKLMIEKELYKDPELKLNDLAEKLNVSANHLSQVINSLENKSFYDYINQYRIDKFCSVIESKECENLTLLAIALDCGFNSKSTFNRNFKNYKGITPSDFLKSINSNKVF